MIGFGSPEQQEKTKSRIPMGQLPGKSWFLMTCCEVEFIWLIIVLSKRMYVASTVYRNLIYVCSQHRL